MRPIFLLSGLLLTAVGIIGLFVPLMPTTIFLILAAGCFSKSSPSAERWLLDHRRLGPPLRSWREHGAISAPTKAVALTFLWLGVAAVCFVTSPTWVKLVVVAAAIAITAYILSRPSRLVSRPSDTRTQTD